MSKKQRLAESLLRKYIQREIKALLEAEEEAPTAPVEKPKEEPKPEAKPKPKPVEEPAEEAGLNPDFDAAVRKYIANLKSATESVQPEDLIDMVGTIINTFTDSSESKMNILRTVKTNIVK